MHRRALSAAVLQRTGESVRSRSDYGKRTDPATVEDHGDQG